jgi:hypothetical protein
MNNRIEKQIDNDLFKKSNEEKINNELSTNNFPNEIFGYDKILFKKEWEKMNCGEIIAKYNLYYKGYDIDFGGYIFGSIAEMDRFMKDYTLSISIYNKYKHMPEIPIKESIVNY